MNTAEAFHLHLRRAKMGVWHRWSDEHQHRYLDQLQFHWDHRPKTIKEAGRQPKVMGSTPVMERLRLLFDHGADRRLRWTEDGGIEEVERGAQLTA